MGVVKADVRALKRLRDRLLELEDGDKREDFCEECAKELAARLLALVIKRTPVDTGYLRRGWTGGKSAGAKAFADSLTVEHSGDTYTIIVENPVEYASYVEYLRTESATIESILRDMTTLHRRRLVRP